MTSFQISLDVTFRGHQFLDVTLDGVANIGRDGFWYDGPFGKTLYYDTGLSVEDFYISGIAVHSDRRKGFVNPTRRFMLKFVSKHYYEIIEAINKEVGI